jgi:hypothetical protein
MENRGLPRAELVPGAKITLVGYPNRSQARGDARRAHHDRRADRRAALSADLPVTTAAHAIEATGLGRIMRESMWGFPIVETIHIAAFAIVVGSIVVLDLRLVGLSRACRSGASRRTCFRGRWARSRSRCSRASRCSPRTRRTT